MYFNEPDTNKKIVYQNIMCIKKKLVYLETKECRQNTDNELRLRQLKYATEMFRRLLKKKEEFENPTKIIVNRDNIYD